MTQAYSGIPMDLDPLLRTPPPDPNGLNIPSLNTITKSEAAEKELNRLLAEVRKIANRKRKENARRTAIARRSPFVSIWDKWIAERTKVGIQNPGDLCYRNVLLQLLAHSPALMRWAWWYNKHHIPAGHECHMGKAGGICKPCHLHNFLSNYWDSREGDLEEKIDKFWTSIHTNMPYINKKGQQDPSEIFMDLRCQIMEDIPPVHRGHYLDICQTGIVTHKWCEGEEPCKSDSYEEEYDWPILFVEFSPRDKISNVDEAVQRFFTDKDYIGTCRNCREKEFRLEYITKPSEMLVVELNRIDEDKEKIENPINFEGNIQLRKEYFDPRLDADTVQNINYELTSVIFHSGPNVNSGHYTIIVKGRTGKWTLINDTETAPISFSNFCRDPENKKNAYMFVYTRLSRNPSADRMLRYNKIFTQDRVSKRLGITRTRNESSELLDWDAGKRTPPGILKVLDMVDGPPRSSQQPPAGSRPRQSPTTDQSTQTQQDIASLLFADKATSPRPRKHIVPIQTSVSDSSSEASLKKMPRQARFINSEDCTAGSNLSSSSSSSGSSAELELGPEYPSSESEDEIETVPREPQVSNADILKYLKEQKRSSPPRSSQNQGEELPHPGGKADPAGPFMGDDQFEMNAYTEGRPYHNKNSWLRIQYIEYQGNDRDNPDKNYRVPLDFAVRGYPINLLKNPCDSGINADLVSILGQLKDDDEIMAD